MLVIDPFFPMELIAEEENYNNNALNDINLFCSKILSKTHGLKMFSLFRHRQTM